MLLEIGQVALGLGTPPLVACVLCRFRWQGRFYFTWCTSATGGMIGSALPPAAWTISAGDGVSLVLAAVLWWLSRRRRRRAPKLAGAKSKALLAAVVAKMRETAKPRPVFRPAPGGAR